MRAIILFIALMSAVWNADAQDRPETAAQQPCSELTSQLQLSACWAKTAADAEASVSAYSDKLQEFFRSRHRPELVPDLTAERSAWLAYASAHCSLYAKVWAIGSGASTAESVCRWRLSRERLNNLHRLREESAQ